MAKGFVYLVAVMDWFSRRVLSWRLSITMETDFCVDALREAMDRHGRPEIFNTDQGVQFTNITFLCTKPFIRFALGVRQYPTQSFTNTSNSSEGLI